MKERLIKLLKQAQSHYTDWGTGVTGTWEEFYFADFGQIVFTSREEAERISK